MLIFQIIAISFVTISIYQVVKQTKTEYASFVLIGAGVIIFLALSDYMVQAINLFKNLADKSNIGNQIISILLKIVGIGYICEYASSICEDADCSSLAKKIELGGKLVIFVMGIPIINNIVSVVENLL